GSNNGFSPPIAEIDKQVKTRRWRSWLIAGGTLLVVGAGVAFWLSNSRSETESAGSLLRAVPFAASPGYEMLPSFSPEGTRAAFSWHQPGSKYPEVYIKLLGLGEPVRLSSAGGFGPTWSPDGRFVAFLRGVDFWHAAVVVIPAVGGQEREVTRTTFDAAFSSDDRFGWAVPSPFVA